MCLIISRISFLQPLVVVVVVVAINLNRWVRPTVWYKILMVDFPMDRKFAPLSESLLALVEVAYKGLCTSVSILMFFQILHQWKSFLAMFADVLLLIHVLQVVTFQRELAHKKLLTVPNIAFKEFFSHFKLI